MAVAVEQNFSGKLEGVAVTRYKHGLPTRSIQIIGGRGMAVTCSRR